MKRNILALFTIFVPTFCSASFGEDFNSLLDKIFDPTPAIEVPEVTAPKIDVPDEPTSVDVAEFRKKIIQEEAAIEELTTSVSATETQLKNVSTEHADVAAQVQWLDEQIGAIRQQQGQAEILEKKWLAQLEGLAQQRTFLAAQLRAERSEYENLMRKKIVRSEGLTSDEWGLWRWLFGTQTVSQQLERQRREEAQEKNLAVRVVQLGALQEQLDTREAQVGMLYQSAQVLHQKLVTQRQTLEQLADARARVQARLEFDSGELQQQLQIAATQRAEASQVIEQLRTGLAQWEDDGVLADDPGVSLLAFPLGINPVVTATFRDPEYKKNLGREHWGVDFAAPQGTPISVPADGLIKKVAQNGYQYSYLVVDHGDDLYTVYGHVSDVLVEEGDHVEHGDPIALTGGAPGMPGSGFFTTGPHLHFEVFFRGQHVDPLKFLPLELTEK